jgi:hypothetical protein
MNQIDGGIRRLAASEPSAEAVSRIAAAARSVQRGPWLTERRWGIATVPALAILVAVCIHGWRVHGRQQEAEKAISAASAIANWKSPTQDLLQFPVEGWLKTPPRLGEYFYNSSADGDKKER